MNMAITDRSGHDESPLTLRADVNEAETATAMLGRPVEPHLPAIGTHVCAIGAHGWKYIGSVVSVDHTALTYTIKPVASRIGWLVNSGL
jgi:hypothetical protein